MQRYGVRAGARAAASDLGWVPGGPGLLLAERVPLYTVTKLDRDLSLSFVCFGLGCPATSSPPLSEHFSSFGGEGGRSV